MPVESIIHENQQSYYAAINASNAVSESTKFIELMLSAIKASLMEAITMSDDMSDGLNKSEIRWRKIEEHLKEHTFIMNSDLRRLCDVSPATVNRIFSKLVDEGKLIKIYERGQWKYKVNIKKTETYCFGLKLFNVRFSKTKSRFYMGQIKIFHQKYYNKFSLFFESKFLDIF